jgi:uncharacterized protein YndB with AHSA1/START domain
MAAKDRKDNEIYLTRIFDAPVKTVWEAWTDPKQVGKWWGPRGFTITTHSMDVKTGGTWSYVMHGPDGTDYVNKTKFLEVEKYARMVYDHGGNDDRPALFRVTVSFSETDGKTKMEMAMALATAEAAKETKKFIKKAGGDSTWDRLAEYVTSEDRFVINRSFDVSLDTMFDLWIRPEHLSRWLPPTGFNMEFINTDVREGGTSFFSMTGPQMKMYGKVNFREIRRPDRIVSTQVFCDEQGNVSRHPAAPLFPETMLRVVTFADEGEGRTRVTVCWNIFGEATEAERKAFREAKGGMTAGWTGSFDKLEELIKA